jgi:hypothetical protein
LSATRKPSTAISAAAETISSAATIVELITTAPARAGIFRHFPPLLPRA